MMLHPSPCIDCQALSVPCGIKRFRHVWCPAAEHSARCLVQFAVWQRWPRPSAPDPQPATTARLQLCQDCGGPLTNAEAHSTADSTTPSSVENCCAGSASASPPAQRRSRPRQFKRSRPKPLKELPPGVRPAAMEWTARTSRSADSIPSVTGVAYIAGRGRFQ